MVERPPRVLELAEQAQPQETVAQLRRKLLVVLHLREPSMPQVDWQAQAEQPQPGLASRRVRLAGRLQSPAWPPLPEQQAAWPRPDLRVASRQSPESVAVAALQQRVPVAAAEQSCAERVWLPRPEPPREALAERAAWAQPGRSREPRQPELALRQTAGPESAGWRPALLLPCAPGSPSAHRPV